MKSPSFTDRFARTTDGIFDAVGMRPIGMVVFAASLLLFVQLLVTSGETLTVEAVAEAGYVEYPALTRTFVMRAHVQVGDRVAAGTPLVELSPHFIDQRLQRLALEIEELEVESRLAQAKLRVREERWVEPALRTRPAAPSLEGPTLAYFERQIAVEQARREALLAQREALSVSSQQAGVVAHILSRGAGVEEGTPVAILVPEFASEIVAYVAPETPPEAFAADVRARIRSTSAPGCAAPIEGIRRGAAVQEAPPQLRQWLRFPVIGLPIHLTLPEGCRLGVGQIVDLEFRFGAAS